MDITSINVAIVLYAIPTSIAFWILFKLGYIVKELSEMNRITINNQIGKHLEDIRSEIQQTRIKLCNSIDYHGKPKDNEPKDNKSKDNKWKLD